VNQIAESAVVQDDLDAVAPDPAKKPARKRKPAKKTARKKATKKATAPKSGRRGVAQGDGKGRESALPAKSKSTKKTARKTARKPAKKAAKKATKRGKKAPPKKPRRGKPPGGNAAVIPENAGDEKAGPRATKSSKRARPHLRCAPEAKRCQATVHAKGAEPKRCSRYRVKIDDDVYDDYCSGHSNTERATLNKQRGADRLASANADRKAGAEIEPLFQTPCDTQDDVARERMNLVRHAVNPDKAKRLTATAAGIAAQLLKDMSGHIERFGSHQGKEGGHSIMRLLPGATIVEANFEMDRVFTKDDYEAIMDGMAQDVKDGVTPARDVAEQAKRYLGRTVRPRDRSRYDTETGAFSDGSQ